MIQMILAPEILHYVRLETIRLPFFSGDKGETKYNQHDETTTEDQIWQAVLRSVKGSAAEVVTNMNNASTIEQLLEKFDVRFGNDQSLEQMLQDFYISCQQSSKSVVDWGCRLEDSMVMIGKRRKFTSIVTRDMLRRKFWSGWKSEYIRAALRQRFDAGEQLEELIKKARVVEREQLDREKSTVTKEVKTGSFQQSASGDLISKKLDEMLKQMRALDGRVQKIETHQDVIGNSGASTLGERNRDIVENRDPSAALQTSSRNMDNSSRYGPGWNSTASYFQEKAGSSDRRGGRPMYRRGPRSNKRNCYICGASSHLSYNCPLN